MQNLFLLQINIEHLKNRRKLGKIWSIKVVKKLLHVILCGCKVNQYESNAIINSFIQNGYDVVNFDEKADVYIVNTCTVTSVAEKKSRQILRKAKKINPKAILAVCGCYVETGKEELKKILEIDIILGNNEKSNVLEKVEKYLKEKNKIIEISNQCDFVELGVTTYTENTRAVIKIQDGCNNFCSYCIIPYARGRIRSRKLENIVSEISEIAKIGFKEIVITGIHIASYGKDFAENISLIDLLEEINKIEGIERIRLGSLEPTIITQEFVKRLIKLNKICDHFHLSLQSGCNETLNRMNRKYTIEEFENSVNLLRKEYSNVRLTTDVIVGFPEETAEEFNKTFEFLSKIKFYKMHIFKYSIRKGTKAASMKQIANEIKEERSKKLIQLSDKNEKEYNQSIIGKQVEVLFEEKENEYVKGHTTNYSLVKVKSKKLERIIKKVNIISTEELDLIGEF